MGGLEPAALVTVGVREAALHVSEQLGFQQRIREPGAVDRDQRAPASSATLVDQSRDDFLADSALTSDEHFGITARGVIDFFVDTRIAALVPTIVTGVVIAWILDSALAQRPAGPWRRS